MRFAAASLAANLARLARLAWKVVGPIVIEVALRLVWDLVTTDRAHPATA